MQVLSSRFLLRPRSFEAALRFYRDTLGLHVYREWGGGDQRGVVFFLGGGFLEISTPGDRPPSGPRDGPALWLQVPDLEAAERELRAAGVEILEPPARKPWGLLEMRLNDPDGVPLVLVEVPPDHPLRRRI